MLLNIKKKKKKKKKKFLELWKSFSIAECVLRLRLFMYSRKKTQKLKPSTLAKFESRGALLFNPPFCSIPEILVRKQNNGTDHLGLVWPEYLTTTLKVVHF